MREGVTEKWTRGGGGGRGKWSVRRLVKEQDGEGGGGGEGMAREAVRMGGGRR